MKRWWVEWNRIFKYIYHFYIKHKLYTWKLRKQISFESHAITKDYTWCRILCTVVLQKQNTFLEGISVLSWDLPVKPRISEHILLPCSESLGCWSVSLNVLKKIRWYRKWWHKMNCDFFSILTGIIGQVLNPWSKWRGSWWSNVLLKNERRLLSISSWGRVRWSKNM